LHEVIRQLSMKAARRVKEEGLPNNLLELMADDNSIPFSLTDLKVMCNPRIFTGRAAAQVEEYLAEEVDPLLERHAAWLEGEGEELIV
jgi:adenylosuccinate lyase